MENRNNELQRILELINKNEIKRMGKLFNTELNNYFYDTGTGKVILIDDEIFYIMNLWFTLEKTDLESFLSDKYLNEESLNELIDVCLNENLFRAIKPKTLFSPQHKENLIAEIDSNLQQLILEVTGKCNLRCGYCIYNESYEANRNFNSNNMSIETAKEVVDYFFKHSGDDITISFYGGEPLLNINLIKTIVSYAIKLNLTYKKKLSFAMTTNLTLVTEEVADYLGSIPNLSILCSIDGPEEIHNAYRKFADGKDSFQNVMKGFKVLCESFKKQEEIKHSININAVCGPPYIYDKFDQISEFFEGLEFMPKNTRATINYPLGNSVNGRGSLYKSSQNPKYKSNKYTEIDPLWKWENMKLKKQEDISTIFRLNTQYELVLKRINDRYISDKPSDLYSFHGCCVPGSRRLYVSTDGKFYPCERMGTCPDIGDVKTGIENEKIKKYYVDEYIEKSIDSCSNCWAVRLCSLCYSNRYDEKGLIFNKNTCEGVKGIAERHLSYYHELLEESPNKLEVLKDIDLY